MIAEKRGVNMATIFTCNDLLAHGKEENGALCIQKGFVLSCIAPVAEQIAILGADTRCEGAPAKIFFRLMQPGKSAPWKPLSWSFSALPYSWIPISKFSFAQISAVW